MTQKLIAKTLSEAVSTGDAQIVADLIRQKLSIMQMEIEDGCVPYAAVSKFLKSMGMDKISTEKAPLTPGAGSEFGNLEGK